MSSDAEQREDDVLQRMQDTFQKPALLRAATGIFQARREEGLDIEEAYEATTEIIAAEWA